MTKTQNFEFFEKTFFGDVTHVSYVFFEALFKSEFFYSKF